MHKPIALDHSASMLEMADEALGRVGVNFLNEEEWRSVFAMRDTLKEMIAAIQSRADILGMAEVANEAAVPKVVKADAPPKLVKKGKTFYLVGTVNGRRHQESAGTNRKRAEATLRKLNREDRGPGPWSREISR
jgi:hypothetical protein